MTQQPTGVKNMNSIIIYYDVRNKKAVRWSGRILRWIKQSRHGIKIGSPKPKFVIVLGGDGTILEAARKYKNTGAIIVGLNLGRVGFLASARKEKEFIPCLKKLFSGRYKTLKRLMLQAIVIRKNKVVFKTDALNEIAAQNILGMAELEVSVENHPIQYVHGTGLLVSTATGSTAYNLSARGPIVMPDIKCFIITEILDHNMPTPSMVIKRDRKISLKVLGLRNSSSIPGMDRGENNLILISDGKTIFPLKKGDVVKIKRSEQLIKFAEFEKNYFFKSLQKKFAFR